MDEIWKGPWLRHKTECALNPFGITPILGDTRCTCGLEKALGVGK